MCFVWFWEQTAIISPYSINCLVFITKTASVYCAVRTAQVRIWMNLPVQFMWDVMDKMVLVRFLCQYAIWMFLHQPYKRAETRKDRRPRNVVWLPGAVCDCRESTFCMATAFGTAVLNEEFHVGVKLGLSQRGKEHRLRVVLFTQGIPVVFHCTYIGKKM